MEYYIRKVVINDLFETGRNYTVNLSEGCNCIYGGNGTGKTTIINLIVNSLTADIESLANIQFSTLNIMLSKSKQKRLIKFLTITRSVGEDNRKGIVTIRYEINDEKITPFIIRPREVGERIEEKYGEQIDTIKDTISGMVTLTHVPLLRIHDSELFGYRDDRDEYLLSALRHRRVPSSVISEILDPSIRVLSNLQRQFINQANETRKLITENLESLKSKIIEKVMIDAGLVKQTSRSYSAVSRAIASKVEHVDVDSHVKKLQEAGINVSEEKIKEHFEMWKILNENVKSSYEEMERCTIESAPPKKMEEVRNKFNSSYFGLFAMTQFNDRFLSIVDDVEAMQEYKQKLTKSFRDYETEIGRYFNNKKKFKLTDDGNFHLKCGTRDIKMSELSSGEKHILAILGKAALSSSNGAVFVADEPELSLHLDWQRMILPSIIKLSPKSQIIVATHSPSIFAKGATEIDLEECF